MAATDLTSLSAVKALLEIDNSNSDAILSALITSVSDAIRTLTNRDFVSQQYDAVLNGTGCRLLFLPQYPISEVAWLVVNGVNIPASTGVEVPGYGFDDDSVYMVGGSFSFGGPTSYPFVFPRGVKNVSIRYTAGYVTVPQDVAQVANELVMERFRYSKHPGETSKNIAGNTVSYTEADMPKWARLVLQQRRRVVPIP